MQTDFELFRNHTGGGGVSKSLVWRLLCVRWEITHTVVMGFPHHFALCVSERQGS